MSAKRKNRRGETVLKRKILSILTDIVLIILVLAFTDTLALRVLHSESIWLYIGLYIATYVVVFGAKRGILILLKRKKTNASADKEEELK